MNIDSKYTSGPRIYLAPLADEHISRYMQLSDDPELVKTMGWRPFSPGEKERFLRVAEVLTLPYSGDGAPKTFSIVAVDGDVPIGFVTLKGVNSAGASGELGIAITEREYRSHGYGTEAMRLALSYAFNVLGLSSIGLTVFPDNHRAIRAYEKVGFERKEVMEKSWRLPNGEYIDMLLMECTRTYKGNL